MTPTRDEVRQWLQGYIADDIGLPRTKHLAKAALAAVEDAERLDCLAYDLEGGPIFDQLGAHDVHEIASCDPHVEAAERGVYCRAFREAIDAARGR